MKRPIKKKSLKTEQSKEHSFQDGKHHRRSKPLEKNKYKHRLFEEE